MVPTRYKALYSSTEIQSNQYSVTEHMSHLSPGSGRGLPGVYFYYEVNKSAIMGTVLLNNSCVHIANDVPPLSGLVLSRARAA